MLKIWDRPLTLIVMTTNKMSIIHSEQCISYQTSQAEPYCGPVVLAFSVWGLWSPTNCRLISIRATSLQTTSPFQPLQPWPDMHACLHAYMEEVMGFPFSGMVYDQGGSAKEGPRKVEGALKTFLRSYSCISQCWCSLRNKTCIHVDLC